MEVSILERYILSLLDRGLRSKYELQRQGGISLGSSTPALKRLLAAGLITERDSADGTNRVRQILKVTSAGRRIARQAWHQHLDTEAGLDAEAILRVVDIASHQDIPRSEIIDFLNTMASQRDRFAADIDKSASEGIVGLQERLAAYRANAESVFLRDLAKSLSRTRKSIISTNSPLTKIKGGR
jgi:DNA-binding PadR family transcriptional regulator